MNAESPDRAERCHRDLKFWCWASRQTAKDYITAYNARREFVRELPTHNAVNTAMSLPGLRNRERLAEHNFLFAISALMQALNDAQAIFPTLRGADRTRQLSKEAERFCDFSDYADEHYRMLIPDDVKGESACDESISGFRVLRGKPDKLSNVEHTLVEIKALSSLVSKLSRQ
jgi:hypothetical protein